VWGGDAQSLIYGDGHSIRFTTPGTLYIDTDPDGTGAVDYINEILAPGVEGAVYLYVVKGPGGDPCTPYCPTATDVHVIDLSGATESHIMEVLTNGDMADWTVPVKATSLDVRLWNWYGPIVLGIDVQRLDGALECDSLGEVWVRDGSGPTHMGLIQVGGEAGYSKGIHVQGSILGQIQVFHTLHEEGTIEVTGSSLRGVQVWDGMYGNVEIGGDVSTAAVYGDLAGEFHVIGDALTGDGDFPWGLRAEHIAPSGVVDVDGAYADLFVEQAVEGKIDVRPGTLHSTFGIAGVASGGSIHANNIYLVRMSDYVDGEVIADGAFSSVGVAGVTGSINADSINGLTVHNRVEGSVGAVTIADLTVINGLVGTVSAESIAGLTVTGATEGTVSATSSLENAAFDVIAAGATVSAPEIHYMVATGAIGGTVSATAELTDSTFGSIDPNGLVETAYIRDVTVVGTMEGKLAASGALDASVQVGGVPATTGTIDVGTLNGSLGCIGDMYGSISVTNDVSGAIWLVPTYRHGPDGNLFGTINVTGSVPGSIHVESDVQNGGSIYIGGVLDDVSGDLSGGHILIGRSLLAGATITVAPGLNFDPNTEFVTARFNGWGPTETGDPIDPNATITIGNHDPCHGDCPDINVRAVTRCRGDMDCSGEVDFDDVGPFVDALTTDPDVYSIANPGLGGTADDYTVGARLFHGDCNCDGVVDFDDINPFIARLSTSFHK
jgi:hypothetical protein